jgi:hypothetical protein
MIGKEARNPAIRGIKATLKPIFMFFPSSIVPLKLRSSIKKGGFLDEKIS